MNACTAQGPDTPFRRRIPSEDERLDPAGFGYAFLVADIEWGSTAGPFAARKLPPGGAWRVKMDHSGSGYACLVADSG